MNVFPQTSKKRVLIYCRVSTKDQVEEGNSLVTQERICKEYAIKNEYDIVDVYRERGESAKTADRPELNKLMKFCSDKKNGVKVVIIYKLDRLSRNTDDYSQLRLLLKKYGVEIKSTSEQFENTPVGRFMENTLANISQFDNDIRAERCSGGMKEAIREGRYVWKAPIGYDNAKIGGKATIAINSIMAPLVHRAFEMVAGNNDSVQEVYRVVTKAGLTRNGKPLVNSYFREMLTNELYTGWICKFGERHKGLFQPIVSDELFAQVQRVLKYRGKLHSQHISDRPDFPLRRFVTNENGEKLTGSWSTGRRQKYPYYRLGQGCGTNYKREDFEKAFMEYMDMFALKEQNYQKLRRFIKEELLEREQNEQNEANKVKHHINDLMSKQTILIHKNMDGVISDTMLKQQLEVIDLALIEANSALATTPIDGNIDIEEAIDYLEPYLKNPSEIWRNAQLDVKLALQRFQFPLGVILINGTFGTAETCCLFKIKSEFMGTNFATVDISFKTWNTPKPADFEKSTANSQENKESNPNQAEFSKAIAKDLISIYRILRGENPIPP